MMGMVISVLKHYLHKRLDVRSIATGDLNNDGDIDVLSVSKIMIKWFQK
jgi:hypothetical protein